MALQLSDYMSLGIGDFLFCRSDFHFAESIRFHPVNYRFRTTLVQEARVRRHAVRCQMKLGLALMERQEMLRKTLKQLKVRS